MHKHKSKISHFKFHINQFHANNTNNSFVVIEKKSERYNSTLVANFVEHKAINQLINKAADIGSSKQNSSTLTKKVLYSVITLPKINDNRTINGVSLQRRINVKKMAVLLPELSVFTGSDLIDKSCVDILNELGVIVSQNYEMDEKGKGWVHLGKIGHWCSFLRYMKHCNESRAVVCVWIEDDVFLNSEKVKKLKKEVSQFESQVSKPPIIRLGPGDSVHLIDGKSSSTILQRFSRPFQIEQPVDRALVTTGLVTKHNTKQTFNHQDRIFSGSATSTIVCADCPIDTVHNVNRLIQGNIQVR